MQFIINAPVVLKGLWAMIKGWIDPVTAAKFRILGKDYQAALLEVIDADQLPVEYGGRNPYEVERPREDPEKGRSFAQLLLAKRDQLPPAAARARPW